MSDPRLKKFRASLDSQKKADMHMWKNPHTHLKTEPIDHYNREGVDERLKLSMHKGSAGTPYPQQCGQFKKRRV